MSTQPLSGTLLDEQVRLSLEELSQFCSAGNEWVVALVNEGILDPLGNSPGDWVFVGSCVSRAHAAQRLEHDLGINLAGVALVLELLDEVDTLRSRIRRHNLDR